MSHDNYDDGLVHGHSWDKGPVGGPPRTDHPVADAITARTPSTVDHDDHYVLHG
jgi:hypothetical protein